MTSPSGPGDFMYNPAGAAPSDTYGLGALAGTTIILNHNIPNSNLMPLGNGRWGSIPSSQSGTDFMGAFINSSMSSNTVYRSTQSALFSAGYYGSQKPHYGIYTALDKSAMAQAMSDYADERATNPGLTFAAFLAQHAGIGGGGSSGGGRLPLTISYTDPAELKQTLQQAAQNALGRDLNESELDAFVKQFHGQEASAQRRAYNGGGSVVNPSASGEALQQMDDKHQGEEQQRLQATYLDALNQALGNK